MRTMTRRSYEGHSAYAEHVLSKKETDKDVCGRKSNNSRTQMDEEECGKRHESQTTSNQKRTAQCKLLEYEVSYNHSGQLVTPVTSEMRREREIARSLRDASEIKCDQTSALVSSSKLSSHERCQVRETFGKLKQLNFVCQSRYHIYII